MKVLVLSRYSRLGASSRLRMLDYVPELTAMGFQVEVTPFFDTSYLTRLYAGERVGLAALRYFTSRFARLVLREKPDLIWLEKEAFAWLPWGIEKAILPRHVPLVSDYDDAVFHRYDLNRSRAVKFLLGRKIDDVMAASDLVMAGNSYLANRARLSGAKKVVVVPTVVDTTIYTTELVPHPDARLRIGWIGSPSTWNEYCVPLLPVLTSRAESHGAVVRAVGASSIAASSATVETLPWSESTEVQAIQGMDVGVMPLVDSPWARGKCGYKLIQYMACGLPVVASPVGVNNEIVEHGVNGFLAKTDNDWANALDALLGDADLRRRMGAAGRKKVEKEYSLQVYRSRVAELLKSAVDLGRARNR